MMKRTELVSYLDDLLNIKTIADYGPQGLQIEGRDEVNRIAVGVDAAHATIDGALAAGADMLIVHHGIFWGPPKRIAGAFGYKVRRFIEADLNLYAAHLALDAHPTLGNNAELCRLLALTPTGGYFNFKGLDVGIIAEPAAAVSFETLAARFADALQPPLKVDASGPKMVRRVAVCSGDAARSLEEAFELGCDTLVTGELDYTMAHAPAELGMNVLYGGHYVTETVGVQALARHLNEVFDLPWTFVDAPVGQ
jgi:dinuclear metal center YbgI/SA1388 family protein